MNHSDQAGTKHHCSPDLGCVLHDRVGVTENEDVEELGRRMWVPEPTMITSTKPGLLNDPVRFAVFRHLQETIVAKADAARMRTRLVFTNSSLSLFESPCTGLPLHTIKVASRKTNTRFSCNKRSRFRVQSTVWWSPSNGLPYKRAFYFFYPSLFIAVGINGTEASHPIASSEIFGRERMEWI